MENSRSHVGGSEPAVPARPPLESHHAADEAARRLAEAAGAELQRVGLTQDDVRRLAESFVAGGGHQPRDFLAWVYKRRAHKQLGEPPGS